VASKGCGIAVFIIALLAMAPLRDARAASQMDQLHTLIDQLHQTQSDWSNEVHKPAAQYDDAAATRLEMQVNTIRKRIIAFVQTMNPKPPLPPEFNEVIGKATYQFKNAKGWQDYFADVDSFGEAADLAPWLPDPYFNMGLAAEKMHAYSEAIEFYGFYLLAAPNAPDAQDVEQKIGGLKYADQHKDEEFASDYLGLIRDQYWGAYQVWACNNCTPHDYFDMHSLTINPVIANQFTITVNGASLEVTDANSGAVWFRGTPHCISYRMCFAWNWTDARSGRAIGGLINGQPKATCSGRPYNQVLVTPDTVDSRAAGQHTYWQFDKQSSSCN
jgi:tetratricopeptide (TPR) repeat protein